MLVRYGSAKSTHWLKSTYHGICGKGWLPHFQCIYHYNSAADCSISLKFGTESGHVTADALKLFKVKVSKIKVTWLMSTKISLPERKSGSSHRKDVCGSVKCKLVLRRVCLLIKAENDWHDVGRPSSCNASQLSPFYAAR